MYFFFTHYDIACLKTPPQWLTVRCIIRCSYLSSNRIQAWKKYIGFILLLELLENSWNYKTNIPALQPPAPPFNYFGKLLKFCEHLKFTKWNRLIQGVMVYSFEEKCKLHISLLMEFMVCQTSNIMPVSHYKPQGGYLLWHGPAHGPGKIAFWSWKAPFRKTLEILSTVSSANSDWRCL